MKTRPVPAGHRALSAGAATAGAALLLTAVVGCGATGGTAGRSGSSAAPLSSATTGPSAGATESNPPGDIPDNQAYVPFTPAGAGFSVKIPEGWARTTNGTTTVFSDKLNKIAVAQTPASTPPTVASVKNNEIAPLRSTVPKFSLGAVSSVVHSGGPVILTTYQGDSAPDPVTGKVVRDAFERYTYYRSGQRADLTLSGPTNADNVDPWKIVSDSFQWVR